MERLRAEVAAEGRAVVETFWGEMLGRGSPLVEEREDGNLLVTFLWRGDEGAGPVAVFSAATGWTQPRHLLARMPGTDVWHGTFVVPPDARFTYRVSLKDNLRTYYLDPDWRERSGAFRPDPLNPDTVDLGGGAVGSLFEGPEAPASSLVQADPAVPSGRVMTRTIHSRALDDDRTVDVYLPPGAEAAAPHDNLPLLVVLDGSAYTSMVPTPTILDNLIAAERLPDVVAVFVDPVDRVGELSANPDFTSFLADELVPELRRELRVGLEPSLTTIAGASLGGLAAAYAALSRPEVFGAVLSQSGAFWWSPEDSSEPGWTMRAFAAHPRLPVRFYLEVGTLETEPIRGGPTMLHLTRHMRDVLCAKGNRVWYRETDGDHAYATWRHTFGAAVEAIALPSGTPTDGRIQGGCMGDATSLPNR